jgi:hypothetical protein
VWLADERPSHATAGGNHSVSRAIKPAGDTSVKHSGFEMLVVVRPLLVCRLALGAGFRLLVLLWLSFDFSVHTGNTSFSPIDTIGKAKDTIFFICQIDFFYHDQNRRRIERVRVGFRGAQTITPPVGQPPPGGPAPRCT